MASRLHENPRVRNLHDLLKMTPDAAQAAAVAADGVFRDAEKRLFATEGADGGAPWAPLEPEYKAQKDRWFSGMRAAWKNRQAWQKEWDRVSKTRRGFGENKILQLSGAMKRGLSTQGGEHVVFSRVTADGRGTITLGVQGRAGMIASYHHDGIPSKHGLKRRPPIQLSPEVRTDMAAAIRKALEPWVERSMRALMAWMK